MPDDEPKEPTGEGLDPVLEGHPEPSIPEAPAPTELAAGEISGEILPEAPVPVPDTVDEEPEEGDSHLVPPRNIRFDITEELLQEVSLSWEEYCVLSDGERFDLISELIDSSVSRLDPDEAVTIDELVDIARNVHDLLNKNADRAASVVTDHPKPTASARLSRWLTGIRTLGFSELGRFLARKASSEEASPEALEMSIMESRRLAQAQALSAGTAVMTGSTVGRQLLHIGMAQASPAARAALGVTSGASTYFSVQQLSQSALLAVRRQLVFQGELRRQEAVEGRSAWASFKHGFNQEDRAAERAENLAKLTRFKDRFFYRLTSNRLVDGIAQYYEDRRLTPDDLEAMVADPEKAASVYPKLTYLAGALQYDLDQRWQRGDKAAGMLDESDWQVQLYVKAMALLAAQPTLRNIVPHEDGSDGHETTLDLVVNTMDYRYEKERGVRRILRAGSVILGATTGILVGVASAYTGLTAGKHPAEQPGQPTTPDHGPHPDAGPAAKPESAPVVELKTAAVEQAIEQHALTMLDHNVEPGHLAAVNAAISGHNDAQFFALTGHHLNDLDYLEHALRAQLAEQVAQSSGHTDVDVWRANGTVDTSAIESGHLTDAGLSVENGHLTFEHLTQSQLTDQLQHAGKNLLSGEMTFAQLRVAEVAQAMQHEATVVAATHHANLEGFNSALQQHLTNLVNANHGDPKFELTNLEGSSMLRVEARHFLTDWVRDHSVHASTPEVAPAALWHHPHVAAEAGTSTRTESQAGFDWRRLFVEQDKPHQTVEAPTFKAEQQLTLADRFTGQHQEAPTLDEPRTLIDHYVGDRGHEAPVLDQHHSLPEQGTVQGAVVETNKLTAADQHHSGLTPAEKHPATVEAETFSGRQTGSALHQFKAEDRMGILIGEADLGPVIPNDQSTFLAN